MKEKIKDIKLAEYFFIIFIQGIKLFIQNKVYLIIR